MLRLNTDGNAAVRRWARFLAAHSEEEFRQLATESPVMQEAKDRLEHLSQDPDARRRALEREDSELAWQIHMGGARREGKAEGIAEGKAEAILQFLDARGLIVTDAHRERILRCSSTATLDAWTRAAATAESVDELFSS